MRNSVLAMIVAAVCVVEGSAQIAPPSVTSPLTSGDKFRMYFRQTSWRKSHASSGFGAESITSKKIDSQR